MALQIPDIKSVADLGSDWTLIGVDSGDTRHVKLQKRWENYIAIINMRVGDEGNGQRVICILGWKGFLSQDNARLLVAELSEKYKLRRQIQPVDSPEILRKIYSEWANRVKSNKVAIKDEKTKDTVSELDNVKEAMALIERCLKDDVSDLHLEVRSDEAKIRRRINGKISLYEPLLTAHQGKNLGNTIYNVLVSVGSELFDPKKVQDGLIDKDIGTVRLRGRVATVPVQPDGFDMVIRLLKIQNATKPKSLLSLGFSGREVNTVNIAINKPSGLVVLAGTTGSGKSSTLQNILMTKILEAKAQVKVITVEDPVEYFIPNATQVSVTRDENGDTKKSMADTMRTSLRNDPDILMIGEIRDSQSCDLVKSAVQSGHPVYSTLHASSCIGALTRLEALGLEREILGSQNFLSGLFYQKLLGKICPHCAKPFDGQKIPFRLSEKDILTSLKILSKDVVTSWYLRYQESNYKAPFVRYLQDKRIINCEQADSVATSFKMFNSKEAADQIVERIHKVSDYKNDTIMFMGAGCKTCKGTGVIGRVPVIEGITFDAAMLELVTKGDENALTTYWRKNKGGQFVLEDAITKMRMGLVDPLEIEGHLGFLDSITN